VNRRRLFAALFAALVLVDFVAAQETRRGGGRGRRAESRAAESPRRAESRRGPDSRRGGSDNFTFHTEFAPYDGDVLLARPTATTMSFSILWKQPLAATIVARPVDGGADVRKNFQTTPGVPVATALEGLRPGARYRYEIVREKSGERFLPAHGPGYFQTARAPGSPFVFAVQADSHLDEGCSGDMYRRTLANAAADGPDFFVDLGDTFMTDKHPSRESAARHYDAQRMYFGLIGHSTPWFMALGNHDGENGERNPELSAWSFARRTERFLNPVPDAFYSGNATPHPQLGLLQNYYAFTWGDALCAVLDPYWSSTSSRGGRNPWGMTLGDAQYRWLAGVLRGSSARFKFLFIHQLTGSYHSAGRGGSEASEFCEWGGKDLDGRDAFAQRRPRWEAPIHRLLVENGVSAVFHGHDHFYARQERDGVVYQLVPQPARLNDRSDHAAEYGYREGEFLPSSGHLRVRVGPDATRVEYVRAALSGGRARDVVNGQTAATYEIKPRLPQRAPR
jgi:hypothetical protein